MRNTSAEIIFIDSSGYMPAPVGGTVARGSAQPLDGIHKGVGQQQRGVHRPSLHMLEKIDMHGKANVHNERVGCADLI
jgi:hypothetical protein